MTGAPLAVPAAPAAAPPAITPLDIACGIAFDPSPPRRPRPLPPPVRSAREALEAAVLPALRRAPCLVGFSGGRDSSLVLAAAARVARREGLDLPVPVTNRFPDGADADESQWQERVVAHLGLEDWVRLRFTDELDLIGPYACRLLREHGLLWPFNAHFLLPMLDEARGGSLLTGLGGDDLFAAAGRTRLAAVLAGASRPVPRDLARLALALAPAPVRRRVLARRRPADLPWLTREGREAVTAAATRQEAAEPRRLGPRIAYTADLRYLRVGRASLAAAAPSLDVLLEHPLCAPELWSAVARAGAPGGFASQTEALRALFGGLLPDAVLARSSKASFDDVFWHRHSRAFADSWSGAGVPEGLVDAGALGEHWRAPGTPLALSYTLLQAAWLAARRP